MKASSKELVSKLKKIGQSIGEAQINQTISREFGQQSSYQGGKPYYEDSLHMTLE